jgi:hypothetical protein
MGDRVHSGRRRQGRGQPEREIRIADGALRDEMGGDKSELSAVLQGDQGRPADLAACPGRGWNGDERGYGRGDLRNSA